MKHMFLHRSCNSCYQMYLYNVIKIKNRKSAGRGVSV